MLLAVALVLLLPLAGAAAMGKPLAAFLRFPPKTPDVTHAPFSLPVFPGLTPLILAATVPLLGVAGYLPFGVLCAGIGDLVVGFVRTEQKTFPVS
jgi:hypothetical protein